MGKLYSEVLDKSLTRKYKKELKNLYFQDSKGNYTLLAQELEDNEWWSFVHAKCEQNNYKIPYVRGWFTEQGDEYIDVGSHTEFFVLTNKELKKGD